MYDQKIRGGKQAKSIISSHFLKSKWEARRHKTQELVAFILHHKWLVELMQLVECQNDSLEGASHTFCVSRDRKTQVREMEKRSERLATDLAH